MAHDDEAFLRDYDPGRYPRPSVTVDVVLVSAVDRALRTIVVRRSPFGRIAGLLGLALLMLLVVAIIVVWINRRPIAVHYLKGEFERRGVQAKYHLDKVGFRTQQVSDLVIGDPAHPDLVAKRAIIQMRLKLDGSFAVYRVVARGVRLRGAGPG